MSSCTAGACLLGEVAPPSAMEEEQSAHVRKWLRDTLLA
jgi:hypothetical protein